MSRFVFQNPYGLRHLGCLKWRGLNDRDDRCSPAAVRGRELITSRLERACVPGSMVAYYRNSIASAPFAMDAGSLPTQQNDVPFLLGVD